MLGNVVFVDLQGTTELFSVYYITTLVPTLIASTGKLSPATRRSTFGYCVFLGDNLLTWSSKRRTKLVLFMQLFEFGPSSLKFLDPKSVVYDYRPHQFNWNLYKVVTKNPSFSAFLLFGSHLRCSDYLHFLPNRQNFDGPFIINEILARCKLKKQQAMIFKVDFAKAYDSVRWDYLDDVLISFGFGPKWRSWIRGRGPLSSLFVFTHYGVSPLIIFPGSEAGIFKGYKIDPSTTLSHLFYADDAVFIEESSSGVGIPDNSVAGSC
ncbi:hypothetical protein Tco_1575933 [Tanacetum coccineum]